MRLQKTKTRHLSLEFTKRKKKFRQSVQRISVQSLPVTSCCPANPTGTMPRLFIAVAQAAGSVTAILSCEVSREMVPKPSAAAEEEEEAEFQLLCKRNKNRKLQS